MTSTYIERHSEVSSQQDLTATGDKFTFTPARPVNIIRWGVIADALIDVGVGMTIKADFRPTAGSDTGRGDGNVGDITVTADIAQGKGAYTEEVSGAGTKQKFQVDPGEQVVFQVTDAADTAGTGLIFVEYEEEGFQGDTNVTVGDLSNRIGNLIINE